MNNYAELLASKHVTVKPAGFAVAPEVIHPKLFKFQRDIAAWSMNLGRAALFEAVGLGKTFQQLEYARMVNVDTELPVLILSPLGVAAQTILEAQKLDIEVKRVFNQSDVHDAPIVITNYDRAHLFDPSKFGGVVLDESGILKHYSKTFFKLTEQFKDVPFRLCCTATPAPNDWPEIGNHAMFLGIMHFKDMLARWFVGEGDIARHARLKEYAREDFWRWVTSWAVCISRPGDLGPEYEMDGYDLPPMHIHEHRLAASLQAIARAQAKGRLMPDTQPSATQHMAVKRDSLEDRANKVSEIMADISDTEPVIIWVDTDFEADAVKAQLKLSHPDQFIEVRGSQTLKRKEDGLMAFASGGKRILIGKPQMLGFGLNFQHCANVIFAGVSYSFERTYQALGRVHRFGQTRDVHVHMIYSDSESNVMQLLKQKQSAFQEMQAEMSTAVRKYGLFRGGTRTVFTQPQTAKAEGQGWTYYLGDCVPTMEAMQPDSVDLTVTSIPFSNLYIYSDSEADVGNSADKAEFFDHMGFVIRGLLRITKPGRCCAVHVKDLPLFKNRDGEMGVDPFSDDVTAAFRRGGWTFQSRVTIEKDPVVEMEKTNSHGLLMMNFKERAEILRVGLPDYVLIFQKPGDIPDNRVRHDPNDTTYFGTNPPQAHEWLSLPTRGEGHNNYNLPVWQKYANPNWSDVVVPLVWTDIRMTNVLNFLVAKSNKDERHIAPLQLDLIARLIHWKSNPGDVVFDPFGGLGSTVYKAIELGRKGLGVELKPEYFNLAVKYLKEMEQKKSQKTLWDFAAENWVAT